MKFVMMSEGRTPHGTTHHQRWWDAVEEAVFAEERGFDAWGTSEHHFFVDLATTSCPEIIHTAVAMRTNRMKIRPMSFLLPIHHPVRVAERLAGLDIFSNGRVELGIARGNTVLQLDGFKIPLEETSSRSDEAVELILKAITNDTFTHNGEHWQVPLRSMTPRPLQFPHMPVYKICSTPSSANKAASDGLGMITSDLYLGWGQLEDNVRGYKEGLQAPDPVVQVSTASTGVSLFSAVCAETNEEAIRIGEQATVAFASRLIGDYPALSRSADYQYTERIREAQAHKDDVHFLNQGPSVVLGDPDYWIARLEKLQAMGVDEVVMIIDGIPHQDIMNTIDMLGRYVIPRFKYPHAVVSHGPVTGADEFQYVKA